MTPIDDFPWVKERAECSLTKVFEMLRQQVAQDVKIRQEMRQPIFEGAPNPMFGYGFSITESGDTFAVLLDAHNTHERVTFVRGAHSIQVKNTNGEPLFEAAPSLNAEGKCIVKIGKQEYPLWYARK